MIKTNVDIAEDVLNDLPYSIEEIRRLVDLTQFAVIDDTMSDSQKRQAELNAMENRFDLGELIELIVVGILKHGNVICITKLDENNKQQTYDLDVEVEHIPCNAKSIPWPQKEIEIKKNRVYGDVRLRYKYKGVWSEWLNIDVKAGSNISKKSLDDFMSGGYYLMNAMADSRKRFYFMVRNDELFQKAVRSWSLNSDVKKDHDLFNVHFERTLDLKAYPELHLSLPEIFDPSRYEKIMRAVAKLMNQRLGGMRNILLNVD